MIPDLQTITKPIMKTKQQIITMTKTMRALAGMLAMSAILALVISCGKNNNTHEVTPPPPAVPASDSVYTTVDEMPQFKGGDSCLLAFIAKTTIYPEKAKLNNITGKVIVRFVVEKDCSVSNVAILKGVDPELDAEAVKVIKSLPPFEKPGIKSGQAVAVDYMIPITFALK
jgi:protein TonB